MAQIYPPVCPNKESTDDPEFQLYKILEELPNNYSIFYSKKIVGCKQAKAETEIDFLIFDGSKTLICLEVKGGLIEYDGYTSGWSQNQKPMNKDPDRQASSACHTLIKHLGNDSKDINIGWALAFPDCSKQPHMGNASEVPDVLILDQRILLEPVKAFKKVCDFLFEQHSKKGISQEKAKSLVNRFRRELHFIQKVGHRLQRDEKAIVSATNEQMDVLIDLEVNFRCVVRGGAGTGKTLIAIEHAKRRENKGDKVLILFYNRGICNSVRYSLGRETSISCYNFDSLAKDLIAKEDPEWWGSQKTKDDFFWENTLPIRFFELELCESNKYDTIIVDEGQDFKAEWFENLLELLKNPKTGRFCVFYDENQNIFGRWNDIPWGQEGVSRKILTKNCRNSKRIHAQLEKLIPGSSSIADICPVGEDIVIKKSSTIEEQTTLLQSTLRKLLDNSIPPGDIVILINSPMNESAIANLKKVGGTKIEWMRRSYRRDSRSIQVTNINNFKGLEAPVILILGYNIMEDKNILYTQISRANLLLYLFENNPIEIEKSEG